jgi:galactokinase
MSDEARQRFEEWATESGWVLSRNKDGSYCTRTTDAAWGGFMAALNIYGIFGQPCDDDTEYLK